MPEKNASIVTSPNGSSHAAVWARGDHLVLCVAQRAEQIHTRDPAACRAHGERRFTHVTMAEGYVRMYGCLLETGKLGPQRSE